MTARSPALLLLCFACVHTSEEPVFQLGGGGAAFQPLVDGDEVPLVFGPQGGWHVDVGLRCAGLEPDGLLLTYMAADPDTDAPVSFVTQATLSEGLVERTEEGWERLGDRVVFDLQSADEVLDRVVRLEVLAEKLGESWPDTVDVRVVDTR